jgi:YHS domain-containing protein
MNRLILAFVLSIAAAGLRAEQAAPAKPAEPAKPAYPLDTCVVSGEKLGNHGEPYKFKYKDREVIFCCKACKKDFLKKPEEFLKKIDDAAKAKEAPPAKP